MKSKYAYLLEDEDVKKWFDNLAAKSYLTAKNLNRKEEFEYKLPEEFIVSVIEKEKATWRLLRRFGNLLNSYGEDK